MKVIIADGGDGSTFVQITLGNGNTIYLNPDIPYCGEVEFTLDEDGTILEEVRRGD